MKNMFGKSHGSCAHVSPLMSFTPTTAKSPLTFMPLKSHSALATWSSKEASNSQRRMFFILGEPMEFGELHVMRFDLLSFLAELGRRRSFLASVTLLDVPLLAELRRFSGFLAGHWSLVCAKCFFLFFVLACLHEQLRIATSIYSQFSL